MGFSQFVIDRQRVRYRTVYCLTTAQTYASQTAHGAAVRLQVWPSTRVGASARALPRGTAVLEAHVPRKLNEGVGIRMVRVCAEIRRFDVLVERIHSNICGVDADVNLSPSVSALPYRSVTKTRAT
jgi:hypothetical protein